MADADKPLIRRRRPRKVKDELPETPDAIDIAMHAMAIGADQSGIARAVLEKHARLIDIQCKREREELENVRVQRIMRWLILAAIAGAIAAAVAGVYAAIHSEALVVEPFEVPPTLSQAGLGGEVMATRVMDDIARMQDQTLSTRPASTYSTNWGDDIKVAVPDTGATIGDIRRLLRSWFGKETRISGEVVQEDGGWTVTGRVSGHTAIVAKGPVLEPLVQQVAEGIFHQTQPYRYITYLTYAGRSAEAMAAARDLAMNGPEKERSWGLVALAHSMHPPDYGDVEVLDVTRQAAAAVPDFPMPTTNYANALNNLGRNEEALAQFRRGARLDSSKVSDAFRGQYVAIGNAEADALLGAYADAAPRMEAASGAGTPVFGASYALQGAFNRYAQHDVRAGDADLRRYAEMTGYTGTKSRSAFTGIDLNAIGATTLAGARIARAEALADKPMLTAMLRDGLAIIRKYAVAQPPKSARDFARGVWPYLTHAMIDGGLAGEAAGLLNGMAEDCYPCDVARGQAAAALGQRAAAERWFAEAKRIGPSFPFADEARGRMLLAARDVAAAQRAFQTAIAIEPRFADAHEGAGEAYAAAHDWKDAAREFARGADYAPRWGKLHIRWGAALWNSGRGDEARAKLKAASSMDLSAADRALLSRLEKFAARSAS